MEKRIQQLYEDMFLMYQRLVSATKWAQSQVMAHNNDPEYCADMAFAMHEMDKLLRDIGVEVRKIREVSELVGGRTWMLGTDDSPIRTEHCTATVICKMQPASPPKGSPEMAELLTWLGITQNPEVVRLHWPSLCDLVTKLVAEGKKLPPCIKPEDMHNPSITMQFHKKKDVSK